MDHQVLIENLIKFGLTRQEAVCYICLFQNGAMTGYEVAKELGISRSNVYTSLNGLTEKGAANIQEGATNRYVALPAEEFLSNYLEMLSGVKEKILDLIPERAEISEGYLTIEGSNNIFNKMKHMILETRERLYISASDAVLMSLTEELAAVAKSGRKVVLISDRSNFYMEYLLSNADIADRGCVIGYETHKPSSQFRLIVDSKYVLTGEISGQKKDTALYSTQRNFVDVFKESMRNEIKLIQISGGKNIE